MLARQLRQLSMTSPPDNDGVSAGVFDISHMRSGERKLLFTVLHDVGRRVKEEIDKVARVSGIL